MPDSIENLPEGEIIQVNAARGFFIVRGIVDKTRKEHKRHVWTAPAGVEPSTGMRVRYGAEPGGSEIKVFYVTPPAPPPPPPPAEVLHVETSLTHEPVRAHRYERNAVAFLNPYNFVRPLASPLTMPAGDPDVELLGRCPPPPHDRYVGVTGRIRCGIETRGAVFVADSHQVTEEDGHRTYRFFRTFKNGAEQPAIPGSSLRGVVRSVFEAVTNSCWEHVHDTRLSRRIETRDAAFLVPGRLHRLETGKWQVELFSGTHGAVKPDGLGLHLPQYAAWVLRYRDAVGERLRVDVPDDITHGTRCWARIQLDRKTHKVAIWSVECIGSRDEASDDGRGGRIVNTDTEKVVEGYYVHTGKNIDNKHSERFFFATRPHRPMEVAADVVTRYRMLLQSYHDLEDARRRDEKTKAAPPSRFVLEPVPLTDEACDGHFVYVRFAPESGAAVVQDVAPVSVPRLFYQSTVRERFPRDAPVEPCSRFNAGRKDAAPDLCPACRTFGWVMASEETEAADGVRGAKKEPERGAYRSRVRFGDAVFGGQELPEACHTLPALSAPKPTTVRFYLMRKNANVRDREKQEKAIDYDHPDMVLRGRKFYRGHAPRTVGDRTPAAKAEPSRQNRTLLDHLPAGRAATFDVHFQNLAPAELGALLWALELENDHWVHRLGLGKPLGMGAVKITVTELRTTTRDRYLAPGNGWMNYGGPELKRVREWLRESFRNALCRRYGANDFLELPNVRDLVEMLSDSPPRLDVDYPTLTIDGETGGHLWFGVNRRAKQYRRRDGQAHWLDLADGDGGLPRDPTQVPPG